MPTAYACWKNSARCNADTATRGRRRPDTGHRLTPLGRKLARLPIDPRLGRMVLAADERAA